MMIDTADPTVILDTFCEVPAGAVAPELYAQVTDYKARTASKYASISLDQVARMEGGEFYISLKLDGEHCHLYYDAAEDPRAFLIRPRGYVYYGLPCLDAAAATLREMGIRRCLMPGELHVRKDDGSRSRIFDVIHHTKGPKTAEDLARLQFAPFDVLTLDDESFVDFREVVACLRRFEGTPIAPPPMRVAGDRGAVTAAYDDWVRGAGHEGLMIRTDLTFRYKLKAQHSIDAAIIGYTAEDDRVTSVLTGLITEDGHVQVLCSVEKGFGDIDRTALYARLTTQHAESDFMEVSRFHTPFVMVRPTVVIELTTHDMVAAHSSGQAVKTAVLRLKNGSYRLLRTAPLASMKHAVFQRCREDKGINGTDLRLSQITDYVFIDTARETGREITFPDVSVLAREVYVKEGRGKAALRKLVAWKTHKETIDPAYTRYVFNFTDYSPGRKDPLKQEVRISSSRAQIMALFAEYKDKYIKAGWKDATAEG